MVPTTVLIIPIFIMEHDLRLTNTFAGVILPLIVSPFGVYFMWAFSADGVSRSLIDSGEWTGPGRSASSIGSSYRSWSRPWSPFSSYCSSGPGTTTSFLWCATPRIAVPLTVGLATILSLGQQGLGVSSYSALLLGAVSPSYRCWCCSPSCKSTSPGA